MTGVTGRPDGAAIPREYSDFLLDLSVALHKHAMYPSGHPALASVAEGLLERSARLFADREVIAIGVARHQLIIEGILTDGGHPVLRRLAEGLHAHQLGAISLYRGLTARELGEALRVLAGEPDRDGALGLLTPDRLPAWPSVRLHPMSFDKLALVSPAAGGDTEPGGDHSAGSELWLGLAQAALAGEPHGVDRPVDADPSAVARVIDAREGEAYDQVVIGHLLQIAEALRSATGAEADALRARTSTLVAALSPATLRRLVRTSRADGVRHGFVRDAVGGLGVDAVLEVLKATADVAGESISHGLLRMLTKLAVHADHGLPAARPVADAALRGQVRRLLADWELDDPNPESYGRLLQQLAVAPQAAEADASGERAHDGDIRLVQMALELGEMGPLAARALRRAVGGRDVSALVGMLDRAPADAGPAAEALKAHLVAPEVLARLLGAEPVDFGVLDRLLPSMSREAYGLLLQALADSDNRVTRRRLLDRLVETAHDVTALIVERLDDPRWYVQRNMLVLLERRGRVPAGFSSAPWFDHVDWRVRYEAVRLSLTLPHEHDDAVRAALTDAHPRVVAVGLGALRQVCPAWVVEDVAAVAGDAALPEDVRLLAIHALGQSGHETALDPLVALVDGGRTLLGRPRLAPVSPLCLAALRALAFGFAGSDSAEPYLALARDSTVDEVREAVGLEAS